MRVITTAEETEGGLLNLVVRWGDQSRLKCADCTCYLRFPQGQPTVTCSRCGSTFRHVEGDLFQRVPDDEVEDADGG